jgi:hypothetical protein
MLGVARWFQLERRVVDVEVAHEARLQLIENLRRVAVGKTLLTHDDMGR